MAVSERNRYRLRDRLDDLGGLHGVAVTDEDSDVRGAEVDDSRHLAADGHAAGIATGSSHSASGGIGDLSGSRIDNRQVVGGAVSCRQEERGAVSFWRGYSG